jgi:hypothetical protein
MISTLCFLLAVALVAEEPRAATGGGESATPTAGATFGEKCALSTDCGEGLYCVASVCRYACTADPDCRKGDCTPVGVGMAACIDELEPRKLVRAWLGRLSIRNGTSGCA